MAQDERYFLAEKMIEVARRSGSEELNLSDMMLTELPETIGLLDNLKKLSIGNSKYQIYQNQLTELPGSIRRLTKLQELDISGNQITRLPEWLGQLAQVQSLNFSNNQLTELPESLGQLAQLQYLNLSHNQLTELPESLGQLAQLQYLNLSHNQLIELPESLGQLAQLNTLNLPDNRLMRLPESLEQLTQLRYLNLSQNQLMALPESLEQLTQLLYLNLSQNRLSESPKWLGQFNILAQLQTLILSNNKLTVLPESLSKLRNLALLDVSSNQLTVFPEWLGNFNGLIALKISNNLITDLPVALASRSIFVSSDLVITFDEYLYLNTNPLDLDNNPLNSELAEAYKQGYEAVRTFLRAKAKAGEFVLNEAKLILVGEGEVGKTCLLAALRDEPFLEGLPTTHGIEIQSFKTTAPNTHTEITLNGWDFGGQRVYRPTHQLFFSAPAVYLVVWKPREGPQQGFVKEWLQLVKRREPSAKILVVATHGGPQQRQPDVDRQELWDLFGKDTIVDFFFVDSKPDEHGHRKGIEELKKAIARVAAELPEVGRSVPKSFADVRTALQATGVPYLPLNEVLAICRAHNMDDEIARLFITISHRLGHLTHYENDPALRDIVILRPDWLATAMSYVLDDEATRKARGLVDFSRLGHLWDDLTRPADTRYPATLHRIFLRLMERFDLSYRVAGLSKDEESNPVSLIAQLVPDTTPKEEDFTKAWAPELTTGDIQQTQICRIVDTANGQSANAEGLFYQLIVRLHRYSLGRVHYPESVHWQRGLVLDADYNGRALLRHIGNDVHITVRAAFPEYFLGMLTAEVKYLVESFWEGLKCEITVPCLSPSPCKGLFEVSKLIESKREGQPKYPCPICNSWQTIDSLLRNAPAAQSDATALILSEFAEVKAGVEKARQQISYLGEKTMGRFDRLDDRARRTLSIVDKTYSDMLQIFTDEAKEGPRLFSLIPVKRSGFNPKEWTSEKFKLILWCEHIRLPLPVINGKNDPKGVYEIELTRDWFKKAAPLLKLMTSALSLALPVAASGLPFAIDKAIYDFFKDSIDFGKDIIDATLSASDKAELWIDKGDSVDLPHGIGVRAENATLRELQHFLKEKDPGFGGLVRVLNKRNEFLWVHEKFAGEY